MNKNNLRAQKALRRMKNRKGQTLVEYALILAFISVVAISVLVNLGSYIGLDFQQITAALGLATADQQTKNQMAH